MELTRSDLLAILKLLGSCDEAAEAADADTLQAIVRNRLNLVVDVAKIDSALARPLPMDWRASLMMRRIELENAAASVRATASGRQAPRGNLVVNIPRGLSVSHYYGANGRMAVARVAEDGRTVLDLFWGEFKNLLMDRSHGLDWQNANPDLREPA